MREFLIIAAALAMAGSATAQPASPAGPSYTFKTWQEAIEKAPCDAFVHVGPHAWKIAGTITIVGESPNARMMYGDNVYRQSNPDPQGIFTHDTFIESPLFAPLDQRCST